MEFSAKKRAGVKRKQKRERLRLIVRELLQDYAQNSTLHGLRYIGEKKLSLVERIFWTVAFVTSLSLCAMLIWNVWVKWQSAPIIVTVSDDLVPIEELPFPSITICPHTKLKQSVCNDSCFKEMQHRHDNTDFSEKRRCYFPGERQLRYFHTYTDNNSKLECLSNYTLQLCGCVWFHMPHNETSTICRASRVWCLQRAIKESGEEEGGYNPGGKCQCYPLCLNVQYEAEIVKILKYNTSQVDNFGSFSSYNEFSKNLPVIYEYDYTRLEIFYKAPKFMTMQRSELFGLTDFMANCGGLLGLFLGFSFLSVIEIVYFCTLRLGCSRCRRSQLVDANTTQQNEELYNNPSWPLN